MCYVILYEAYFNAMQHKPKFDMYINIRVWNWISRPRQITIAWTRAISTSTPNGAQHLASLFTAFPLWFVCKIPLLAQRTRPMQPIGQVRRATIGYLVYKTDLSAIKLFTHDLEFHLVFVCKRMQDHYKTIKQFRLITRLLSCIKMSHINAY